MGADNTHEAGQFHPLKEKLVSTLLTAPPDVYLDPVLYDELLDAIDLSPVNPAGDVADGVPLDEWLIAQAGWWRARHQTDGHDYLLMVADAIDRIARGVRFHRARSVSELLALSPHYRRCDLDQIETPAERHLSALAGDLDSAVEDYLVEPGIAARLVAWTLLGLAEEADLLHADSLRDYVEAKAAFEMAQLEMAEAVAF